MGIRFLCPNGHKLNVKATLAGKIGFCPQCKARMRIPLESLLSDDGQEERVSALPSSDSTAEQFEPTESPLTQHKKSTQDKQHTQNRASNQIGQAEEQKQLSNLIKDNSVSRTDDGNLDQTRNASEFQYVSSSENSPALEFKSEELSNFSIQNNSAPISPVPISPVSKGNPLLADTDAIWYVRNADGTKYGPANSVLIQTWIQERRIAPSMFVWREGWTTWLVAGNVFPELQRLLSPTPPLPVPPEISGQQIPMNQTNLNPPSNPAVSTSPDFYPNSIQTTSEIQNIASINNISSFERPLTGTSTGNASDERLQDTPTLRVALDKKQKAKRNLIMIILLFILILMLSGVLVWVLFLPGQSKKSQEQTPNNESAVTLEIPYTSGTASAFKTFVFPWNVSPFANV